MMGHVGCVNEVHLAGEVGGDLREQFRWNTVKRRLQGIDVTTQHCERPMYVILYILHLKKRVRTGRDTSGGDVTGDEPLQ